MFVVRAVNTHSRLRQIEAEILRQRTACHVSSSTDTSILSCFRDYFAGVETETIAAKMRHGGINPEMVRYYTEDIFAPAKAELTEWREQVDKMVLGVPSGSPQGVPAL